MLGNIDDNRIKSILLCHEADGNLIQNRLQNHKAQSKKQYKSAYAYNRIHNLLSQKITAGFFVSLPEFVFLLRLYRCFSHSSIPPWKSEVL